MEKIELMGVEIWVCVDKNEARQIWEEHPGDRFRIWLEDETWKYCLSSPAELQVVLDKKLAKPGRC